MFLFTFWTGEKKYVDDMDVKSITDAFHYVYGDYKGDSATACVTDEGIYILEDEVYNHDGEKVATIECVTRAQPMGDK